MEWKRKQQKFGAGGLDLSHPVDAIEPGFYPYTQNVRGYQDGRVENRPGLQHISIPLGAGINSIFRMNDYVTDTFARFLGVGNALFYGLTSFTSVDSGYSGNPLSFVNYLPLQAVSGRTYIADSNKMARVDVAGNVRNMGIAPPNIIPQAELLQPLYTTPSTFDATSPFNMGGWGHSGNATLPALNPPTMPGRLIQISIAQILYINGSTGWACIAPTAGTSVFSGASQIVAGMRIQIGTGGGGSSQPTGNVEYATVEEVHKIYPASGVTVGAIVYDTGLSGMCTIAPSASMAGVTRNSMLQIGTEYVRIISVTAGNNGISSFRCSTAGSHSAGEAITPPPSGNLWLYLTMTHAIGEFLWQNVFQFEVTGSKSSPGQGQVATNAGNTSPFALAVAGGRPLTPDDYISMSIWVDLPASLIAATLVLDVDSGTNNTYVPATEGTLNAYIYSFTQGDLQQLVNNIQSDDALRPGNIQSQLQASTDLEVITPLIPPSKLGSGQTSTPVDVASAAGSSPPVPVLASTSSQLYTGASQWTELRIKISDFTRIGADQTADLTAIRAILLNFTCSGNIFVSMAGMWAGGTYGPDLGKNPTPFIYRYRYRDSTTGAKSLPGPAIRSGVTAFRQGVQLFGDSSSDPQVDKIDWERLGGANVGVEGHPDWHYLGTCDNSSPTIIDDQFSAAILPNPPLDLDVYQPFPLVGAPLSLTASTCGTAIRVTSGAVSTNMAVGSEVLIDGIPTEVYATPTSSTLFHVADSIGFGTGIKVEIPEPTLAGQPLPAMWGPFQNTLFACGNFLNAGNLYYTLPENPDGASDTGYLTVTAPSEILMNGFTWNSKCYVFSDKRMFEIILTGGVGTFTYNEIIANKGLFSRWAFAVGPEVWFLASDGIYQWGGGGLECISNNIALLFPKGDRPGEAVNGFNPVDMTKSVRLCYYNNYIFFDYQDTLGIANTLVYNLTTKSWWADTYFE